MDHKEEWGVKKTQGVQNIKSVNIKIMWIERCILPQWFLSKSQYNENIKNILTVWKKCSAHFLISY